MKFFKKLYDWFKKYDFNRLELFLLGILGVCLVILLCYLFWTIFIFCGPKKEYIVIDKQESTIMMYDIILKIPKINQIYEIKVQDSIGNIKTMPASIEKYSLAKVGEKIVLP
jgi:hypothetical protein